jgi:hypothetical protein
VPGSGDNKVKIIICIIYQSMKNYQKDRRATPASSNAAVAVSNSPLHVGCRPATRIDMRPSCREPGRAILRIPQRVVKEIVEKTPKKWNKRAIDRDRVIAEWLN